MAEIKTRNVSFPRYAEYNCAFKYIVEQALGCKYVMPPPLTKRTMELGTKYSPDFVCTPFKTMLGSMIEALEAGADTLLMTHGLCRLGYYGELAEQMAAAQMNWTATAAGYIWPETKSKRITSPMGGRDTGIKGASTNHKGVDIGGVGYTTNVLATKAGVVITSKLSSSYGNYVVISHGPGNTTLYAHMSSRAVKEGDTVTQGQIIGVTGNTGISRGAHLHYEITENGVRVNPLDYLPNYIKAW